MSYFLTLLIVFTTPNAVLAHVTCSESYSCEEDSLSDDIVSCIGYNSCAQSSIESDVTFCTGDYGCSESNIETTRLFCSGNEGCNSASIINSENCDNSFVLCTGFYSCQMSDITATDTVTVFASPWSGYQATIEAQNLYSISASGFINGEATLTGSLWCDGVYSCASSEITFASDCNDELIVQVLGSYGLYNSQVSSGENNQISWYFYGLWAIEQMTISCESGSTCDFYCLAGGCMNYETASYTCNGICNIYCVYTFDDACPSTSGVSDENINVYVLQGTDAQELYADFQTSILEVSENVRTKYVSTNIEATKHLNIKHKSRKLHQRYFFASIYPKLNLRDIKLLTLVMIGLIFSGGLVYMCRRTIIKESKFQTQYQTL